MSRIHPLLWVWCLFLSLCDTKYLQKKNGGYPQGDLNFLMGHRSIILNDKLYFEGGMYNFYGGDVAAAKKELFWLDLNTSFPVDTVISARRIHSIEVQGLQWQGQGAFFTDADFTFLYSFAGYYNLDRNLRNAIETFNTTSQNWANTSVSGGSFPSFDGSLCGYTTTAVGGLGLGFMTAGLEGASVELRGMVRFDASDPEALNWRNESTAVPLLIGATIQYARFGDKGVLIAIGGYEDDELTDGGLLRDMAEIMVYDVASSEWFNVTATGDIPVSRSQFCSTISSSLDDSSHQMTIYGGWNYINNRAYEDVYVLTIPTLQWIKISDINNQDNQFVNLDAGRYEHTCHLYGDRQMIVLGGEVKCGDVFQGNSCNLSYPAIRVLDTTTFKWQTEFSPIPEAYMVPEAVSGVIGGSGSGKPTKVTPTGGFNDSSLTEIFKKSIPRYSKSIVKTKSPTPNSTFEDENRQSSALSSPSSISLSPSLSPSSPSPPSSSPSSSSSFSLVSTPASVIAGGTIGGIAGVVVLSGIIYLLSSRYRREPKVISNSGSSQATHVKQKIYEVHGQDRPVEIDSRTYAEAGSAPSIFELYRSSNGLSPDGRERAHAESSVQPH